MNLTLHPLVPLPVKDLILRFRYIISGYKNYYNFSDNKPSLRKIHWLLKESLIKTLCRKLDQNRRSIISKFGHNISVNYSYKKKSKNINFACPALIRTPMHFLTSSKFIDPVTSSKWKIRSTAILEASCANCNSEDKVEMHHIRHIKTLNVKLSPFDRKAAAINRKQIPLCHNCHQLVHRGQYKGLSLKYLASNL